MRATRLFAAAPLLIPLLMALAFGLTGPAPVWAETAIPEIKEDTPYTEAREALVKQGWSPVPQTPTYCEGGQCGFARCIDGFDHRCKLWPEAVFCRGPSATSCEFLWRKKGTDIVVRAMGYPDPLSVANVRVAKKPIPYEPLPYTQPTIKPPTHAGLPFCKAGDDRIPVPSWTPELNEKGKLTAPPPIGDGRVVFIAFTADSDGDKITCGPGEDGPYYFSLLNDPNNAMDGGLVVNLRGHVLRHHSTCYFRGFYINTLVPGIQHGYVATMFRPVDRFELIASNRFCAANEDAP